ncbi:flagellar biosynthesis/type III secretory pathway protein FliH [Variovorax boronicumulans]|uniref:HrpE/YscL family type III secretion apparatus protein n=1 Tax=Variovorax boronicumulans TaxID=436515 RepID=UPI002788F65E|nr:HrpE/YscL family type III secretion apparatus protein [Variovorax boronicumulans]MDQ0083819.1 flagellar biosynthesis/type III secretory pathway protein FliH [Variovorax boronicumulans]
MNPRFDTVLAPIVRRYSLPEGQSLPPAGALLRRGFLQEAELAMGMVAAARAQCNELLEKASRSAQECAEAATRAAEVAVWSRAAESLRAIERTHAQLLAQSENLLLEMARAALQRLLLDVPADWPGISGIRLLLREQHELQDRGQIELRVHPDEVALLQTRVGPSLHAALTPDAALRPGECLLICAQGELRTDYRASVAALIESLHRRPASSEATNMGAT